MNNRESEKEDRFVDDILKEAYKQVEPVGSWESLRTCIDESLQRLCFPPAEYGTKEAQSLTKESNFKERVLK